MAIDDFGGTVLGKKIELVTGDIQNKADVAATLAGRWYDNEKVDMILGAGASSSSIAIEGVAGEKKKIFLAPDPASSDITGKLCNPYTVHWVYDTARSPTAPARPSSRPAARPGSSSPPTMPSATRCSATSPPS